MARYAPFAISWLPTNVATEDPLCLDLEAVEAAIAIGGRQPAVRAGAVSTFLMPIEASLEVHRRRHALHQGMRPAIH
jgi:hypothetical protein